jgi:hypothetical protein
MNAAQTPLARATPPPCHHPSHTGWCIAVGQQGRMVHRRRSDGVPGNPPSQIAARYAIAATRLLAAPAPAAFHFSEPQFSEGDLDPPPKNGLRNATERPKPALEQHVDANSTPKDTGKRLLSRRFSTPHVRSSEFFRRWPDFVISIGGPK